MSPRKLNETTRRVIGFPDKYAALRHTVSLFQFLPGIRGLWTMADFDTAGNAEDLTSHGLTLTRNGNPLFHHERLIPYLAFDGVGDYLSRADEAATSITASEAYISPNSRGLTCGGWFRTSDDTARQDLIDKLSAAAGNFSWYFAFMGNVAGDPIRFFISDDGTNSDEVDSSNSVTVDPLRRPWQFAVGRYDDNEGGEELAVFLNGVKTTAATARASIFDGNAAFSLAGTGAGANLLTGDMSITFLCATALEDDVIGALFQQSRALYGV